MPSRAESASLPTNVRARLFLVLGISVVVIAVWFTNRAQHDAASRAFEESRSGQGMLTALLDQQTGLRGFALTRREEFLDPYRRGHADFKRATTDARGLAGPQVRALIDRQVEIAEQWQLMAEREICTCAATPTPRPRCPRPRRASACSIASGRSAPRSSASSRPRRTASSRTPHGSRSSS